MLDVAIIEDVVVGHGDRGAFFEFFDFAVVAGADFLGVEGAFGAVGDAIVAEGAGGDDGDDGEFVAWEGVFEGAVFGPRIEAVEDDAFLAGGDEIVDFGDGLADDPILAFGGADHFAEFALAVRGDGDAAFVHFAVDHVAEVDFGGAATGEVVDGDGFAGAAHADDSDDFEIFHGSIVAYLRKMIY